MKKNPIRRAKLGGSACLFAAGLEKLFPDKAAPA